MKKQQKPIRPLAGHFLGWGDDRIPHRYIKLATTNGEQLVKVAKSLRPHIQHWQPGMWLMLIGSERTCRSTGETKIKVKQFLTAPRTDLPNLLGSASVTTADPAPVEIAVKPTKIQVCQGSSCRRRGSDKICRSMQAYLTQNDLTARVEIETVKCLHQCKAAPHAIVTSPATAIIPGKTHYRQLQPSQIKVILAKHFPVTTPIQPIGVSLIEKIGDYLQRHRISTSNSLS